MTIDKNSVVTLGYTLKTRTGLSLEEKQVEQTTADRPFVFIYGAGMLLPDFENNLRGKKSGHKFDFFITAEKGYGVKNDKYIMNILSDKIAIDVSNLLEKRITLLYADNFD